MIDASGFIAPDAKRRVIMNTVIWSTTDSFVFGMTVANHTIRLEIDYQPKAYTFREPKSREKVPER